MYDVVCIGRIVDAAIGAAENEKTERGVGGVAGLPVLAMAAVVLARNAEPEAASAGPGIQVPA